MPDQRRLVDPELVEQLIIEEREVPHIVERAMRLGLARAGSGMAGGVNSKVPGERIMKRGPLRTPSAVQKNQRRPRARDGHVRLYLVVPNADGAFLYSGHDCLRPLADS